MIISILVILCATLILLMPDSIAGDHEHHTIAMAMLTAVLGYWFGRAHGEGDNK